MKIESIEIGGVKTDVYYFDNPMSHEDWHEAEKLGLKYIKYSDQGPDYWDDYLIFAKAEDEEAVGDYFQRAW